MRSSPILVLCLVEFLHISGNAQVYPTGQLSVEVGEGFSTYLVPQSKFGKLLKCQLKYGQMEGGYDLYPSNNSTHITEDYELITSFPGECGAQVRNASVNTKGTWQLIAIDENLVRISGQFQVNVVNKGQKLVHIVYEGNPEEQKEITCPQTEFTGFCVIVDESGKFHQKCRFTVFYPEADESEIYLCYTFTRGSVIPTETMFELIGKGPQSDQDILRTENSVVLSCKIGMGSQSGCIAVNEKSKEIISIQSNIVGDRYSTYKTNLYSACQLEIPTPVLANQTGIWKILIPANYPSYSYSGYEQSQVGTGCIFHLDYYPEKEIEDLITRTSENKVINTMQPQFSFKCEEAPYKLTYCYLKSPTNKIYNAEPKFAATSKIGVCVFDNIPTESGRWTCGYNAFDQNGLDIVQDIRVRYYSVMDVEVANKTVMVLQNETFSLLCRVVTDQPIQLCMFVSPSGYVFNVPRSSYKSVIYSYFGRGLAYGDCGIEFSTRGVDGLVKEAINGNWTCLVNVINFPSQLQAQISVHVL